MFREMRRKNQDIPREACLEILQRRDIVMASYLKARALGDKNV